MIFGIDFTSFREDQKSLDTKVKKFFLNLDLWSILPYLEDDLDRARIIRGQLKIDHCDFVTAIYRILMEKLSYPNH